MGVRSQARCGSKNYGKQVRGLHVLVSCLPPCIPEESSVCVWNNIVYVLQIRSGKVDGGRGSTCADADRCEKERGDQDAVRHGRPALGVLCCARRDNSRIERCETREWGHVCLVVQREWARRDRRCALTDFVKCACHRTHRDGHGEPVEHRPLVRIEHLGLQGVVLRHERGLLGRKYSPLRLAPSVLAVFLGQRARTSILRR